MPGFVIISIGSRKECRKTITFYNYLSISISIVVDYMYVVCCIMYVLYAEIRPLRFVYINLYTPTCLINVLLSGGVAPTAHSTITFTMTIAPCAFRFASVVPKMRRHITKRKGNDLKRLKPSKQGF